MIPANDEAALLPACLHAVLATRSLSLRVIVVANGCTDDTASLAATAGDLASRNGHELIVVEVERANKTEALNVGDGLRRGCSVLYLDADTVLLPDSLSSLEAALAETNQPRLAAPAPVPVRPRSRLTRSFAAIWLRLPRVAEDVVGAGCYAVNPAGRLLWETFPDVIADDFFVRGLFAPSERVVTRCGGFLLVMPEGWDLVRVLRRWRRGNKHLARQAPVRSAYRPRPGGALRALRCLAPRTWRHWPGFLLVTFTARVTRPNTGRKVGPLGWGRATRLRQDASDALPQGRLRIDVVVVTYQSIDHVDDCLSSLHSRLADLAMTAVDNASGDGTSDVVSTRHTDVALVRNDKNLGFARAVNEAAELGDGHYLLLVNPDTRLSEHAIDELLTLALRFPRGGLYGGRATDAFGNLDPTSCLSAPTLSQAISFGLGTTILPGLSWLDPDSLGGWNRNDVRPVPVLTGAFLLVDRRLWRELQGFDETYVLYGEDVDLSVRATALGFRPMFTPRAAYRHLGGASSSSEQRQILILRGKMTLYNRHLPPWKRELARRFLLAGVRIRSWTECARRATRHDAGRHVWTTAWERRLQWVDGWCNGDKLEAARQ